jgi:hypothetical protein
MALEKTDLDQINSIFADAIKSDGFRLHVSDLVKPAVAEAVAAAVETVNQNVTKLQETVAAIPATGAKPDEIAKLVNDAVAANAAERAKADAKAATDAAARQTIIDARDKFLAANGKKLPKTYLHLIPETDDAAKLQEGLAAATTQLEEDLKSVGATLPGLGSPAGGAGGGNTGEAARQQLAGKNPVAAMAQAYRDAGSK